MKLGMHDLRRTFGRVAEELTSYAVVKRLLNHRNTTDPTERYAEPDNERVFEALQLIELHMLMTYQNCIIHFWLQRSIHHCQ
jgi:integrase